MRTAIVEAKIGAIDVKERDFVPVYLNKTTLTGFDLLDFSNFDPLFH